jgi:hypothetical protein
MIIVREILNIHDYLEEACNIIENKGGVIVSVMCVSSEYYGSHYTLAARIFPLPQISESDIIWAIDAGLNEKHLLRDRDRE